MEIINILKNLIMYFGTGLAFLFFLLMFYSAAVEVGKRIKGNWRTAFYLLASIAYTMGVGYIISLAFGW